MNIFKSNKKGITLIELVVVVALLGLAGSIVPMALNVLNKAQATSINEYEIQSSLRLTASKVSDIVRYSQGVFAVPQEFMDDVTKLDPEWQFIALSPDSKSVVIYRYNNTNMIHEPEILVHPKDNIEYEITFKKISAETKKIGGNTVILNDNVLNFIIEGFVLSKDENGNMVRVGSKVVYETEIAATNALQVIDKGTLLSPGVAIGFRKDDDTYGEGRSHVIKISLILDTSGSMAWIPGSDRNPKGSDPVGTVSRITHLKRAIIGDGFDGTSGIVAQFAAYPNFEMTIVPFASRATYIKNTVTSRPFFNTKLEKAEIVSRINGLVANGATNTGDGIRLSYSNFAVVKQPMNLENSTLFDK